MASIEWQMWIDISNGKWSVVSILAGWLEDHGEDRLAVLLLRRYKRFETAIETIIESANAYLRSIRESLDKVKQTVESNGGKMSYDAGASDGVAIQHEKELFVDYVRRMLLKREKVTP